MSSKFRKARVLLFRPAWREEARLNLRVQLLNQHMWHFQGAGLIKKHMQQSSHFVFDLDNLGFQFEFCFMRRYFFLVMYVSPSGVPNCCGALTNQYISKHEFMIVYYYYFGRLHLFLAHGWQSNFDRHLFGYVGIVWPNFITCLSISR